MVLAAVVIAILVALGAWAVFSMRAAAPEAASTPSTAPSQSRASATPPDAARAEHANNLVTERLWKLAFAAPSETQILEPAQAQIRDSVAAALQSDSLDPKYFPRRIPHSALR
jgi:hypothetical protein